MRIISGIFGGRQLYPPKNLPVRPTTDFARTALFNILQNRFDLEDISVIDLFAGTGAISVELASRGCRDIVAVDMNRNCVQFIQDTARSWEIKGLKVLKDDVLKFLGKCPYKADVIFADPPYDMPELQKIPEAVFRNELLRPGGLFILEHGDRQDFSSLPQFREKRRYGSVNFSLFM
jgi:16S rRNA (guanine(966)-N(2))-methyltransferase RsmD